MQQRIKRHGEWIETSITVLLKVLIGIFHMHVSESAVKSVVQFIKFGMVGVSNTLLSYCIYAGTVWIYGLLKTFTSYSFTGLGCSTLILMLLVGELHLSPYLAQAINLMIGIPLNFTLNKLWVFRNASR